MTNNFLNSLVAFAEQKVSKEELNEIKEQLKNGIFENPPKIAVIGKAGVGKSSTVNNLFDADDYVSDVYRGTFEAVVKRFELKGGLSLDVYDMPGLGDDIEKDEEFEVIYKEILPSCDIILYILESLDGSFAEDIRILKDIVLPCGKDIQKRIIIAMNKVDMIGANEGLSWDIRINRPNTRQRELIDEKQKDIVRRLTKVLPVNKERIICYSALKRYQLLELMHAVVSQTPEGWKFIVTGNLPRHWASEDIMDPKYYKMAVSLGIIEDK